jgi:hypothetical protein
MASFRALIAWPIKCDPQSSFDGQMLAALSSEAVSASKDRVAKASIAAKSAMHCVSDSIFCIVT